MNPLLISMDNAEESIVGLMFDPLLRFKADGQLQPVLAESLPIASADGLSYTFKLRKDAKWTDGQPLTAEDVVFTYRAMYHPDYRAVTSPSRSELETVLADVSATDAYTVVMKTKVLNASFLALHSRYYIAPKHVLGSLPAAAINTSDFNSKPTATSGAFTFVEWSKGSFMSFARNPNYFAGPANLERYVVKFATEDVALLNGVQAGEIDFVRAPDLSVLDRFKNDPNVKIEVVKFANSWRVYYNLGSKAKASAIFNSKAVRKALIQAVDRSAVNSTIVRGLGTTIASANVFSPLSWAYGQSQQPAYAFNKKTAEDLLEADGWKRGANGIRAKNGVPLKFEMQVPVNPLSTPIGEVLQQSWKDVGADVAIKSAAFNQLTISATRDRDFDVLIYNGPKSLYDPDVSAFFHSRNAVQGGFNLSNYTNTQLDSLLDQGSSTLDQAKRKTIYAQVESIINEDVPSWDPEWHPVIIVRSARVAGVGEGALSSFNYQTRGVMHDAYVTDGK